MIPTVLQKSTTHAHYTDILTTDIYGLLPSLLEGSMGGSVFGSVCVYVEGRCPIVYPLGVGDRRVRLK